MSDNSNNDKNTAYFRFRYSNLEFELKGNEKFIEKAFSQIKDYIEEFNLFGIIDYEEDFEIDEEVEDLTKIRGEERIKEKKKDIIPLDHFLQQYNSSSPQQKVMAVCLYLVEILQRNDFRSRDISILLKKNKLSPIASISTHMTRLRNKNLLSVVSSPDKEVHYTIYKDSLEKVKNFVKKK